MAAGRAARAAPKVPEIRKGDTVVVLAGKDAGKRGTVERVIRRQAGAELGAQHVPARLRRPAASRVVVEGLNIAKRHTKPRQSAEHERPRCPKIAAGRHHRHRPAASRSARSCSSARSCDKPTRIGHATLDTGRRVRVCRHCGEQLEVKA